MSCYSDTPNKGQWLESGIVTTKLEMSMTTPCSLN